MHTAGHGRSELCLVLSFFYYRNTLTTGIADELKGSMPVGFVTVSKVPGARERFRGKYGY